MVGAAIVLLILCRNILLTRMRSMAGVVCTLMVVRVGRVAWMHRGSKGVAAADGANKFFLRQWSE